MLRHQLLETRRIAKCYLNYTTRHRDHVVPLFELLAVVDHKPRCDYSFVKDFYTDVVADTYTMQEKQKVQTRAAVTNTALSSGPHCKRPIIPCLGSTQYDQISRVQSLIPCTHSCTWFNLHNPQCNVCLSAL